MCDASSLFALLLELEQLNLKTATNGKDLYVLPGSKLPLRLRSEILRHRPMLMKCKHQMIDPRLTPRGDVEVL
jgi:hypothetical protein